MKRDSSIPEVWLIGLLMLLLAGLFAGCEEETSWDVAGRQPELLVVEGMITSELRRHVVRLSRPFMELGGSPSPVSGAVVTLDDGRNTWTLTESDSVAGNYLTPRMQGVIGRTYTLTVRLAGRQYRASTHMVPVTPLADFSWHPLEGSDTLWVLDLPESNIPAMVEVTADWSFVPGYEDLPDSLTHARFYHFTLNNVDPNALFPPTAEEVGIPAGARIIRRKYSLAPDYQEYLRSLLSETAWRGSIFDVLPGNVNTNLSEGATGFFAACTVTEETTIFRPQ